MEKLFSRIQKRIARKNFLAIRSFLIGPRILDLGAAEGFIAREIAKELEHDVQLADVVDLNQTSLPLVIYDGRSLPFKDNEFDTVLIMLTLHHCENPDRVLKEAVRVCRNRVIITESTFRTLPGKWLLWQMDTLYNAIRSDCLMAEALHFRTVREWRDCFRQQGLKLVTQKYLSKGIHRHVLFVLNKR